MITLKMTIFSKINIFDFRTDLVVDDGAEDERALGGLAVRLVHLGDHLDRLRDRVDERQRHPQEVDVAELREEGGAERFHGDAGAVGDEENAPAL